MRMITNLQQISFKKKLIIMECLLIGSPWLHFWLFMHQLAPIFYSQELTSSGFFPS